jgi:hypothetical protein
MKTWTQNMTRNAKVKKMGQNWGRLGEKEL